MEIGNAMERICLVVVWSRKSAEAMFFSDRMREDRRKIAFRDEE
jgi:hypothetical protein